MRETGINMGIQGTIDEWRKELLEDLETTAEGIFQRITWLSARDEHVCPLCLDRDGKSYSVEEAKKILGGEFCKPKDPDDRCRCTFVVDESNLIETD